MASSTLRPHRSPSPAPSAPLSAVNPANPAKLTRQSLGPPSTSGNAGAARGFGALGNPTSPGLSQPRHVSTSGVALGLGSFSNNRDSLSPRPSMSSARAVSGGAGRPSSEFLTSAAVREQARTPEAEQIDQWFKHLASWEATLEEMAAASTDQNFTEELGAIESWFRVLSEAERTAALYSLLQHSTPVQIRFFLSVLQHMAQSDPLTAMLSPSPAAPPSMHAQMESKLVGMGLKSPSASYAATSPVNNYLAPESALESSAQKAKTLRQNRISAPGTLSSSNEARWSSQLDQVMERGPSPGLDDACVRSRSPQPDMRPKSTDFSGGPGSHHEPSIVASRSNTPRLSAGPGSLGLGLPSEVTAAPQPAIGHSGSWASMVNSPLAPMFADPNKAADLSALAQLQLAAAGNAAANSRIQFDDARKYRRPSGQPSVAGSRSVSGISHGSHEDDLSMPGAAAAAFGGWNAGSRSGVDFTSLGLNDPATLGAALNLPLSNLNLGNNPNLQQMMALAQIQQQAANQLTQAQAVAAHHAAQQQAQQQAQLGGYGFPGATLNAPRSGPGSRAPSGRRSPLPGQKSASPNPAGVQQGGGAGGGAGVAGPDDVDQKILDDVSSWLRVLRLHKYTANFERSNWRDMVLYTDQDLQDRGVAAQGARSKFLKVFYNVRTKFDIPHPPGQEEYAPHATKDDK